MAKLETKKMLAAVVEHFGKPLVLREIDIPSPGPGQILVKTEACGVCHTDLHAANGDWPLKPTLPCAPFFAKRSNASAQSGAGAIKIGSHF